MAFVALALSIFIAALGALGIVAPGRLLAIVRCFLTPLGLCAAAALRLVLGLALFLAAPPSRAPQVVRVLGIVIVVSGVLTPSFGLQRSRRLLAWWSARGPAFMRAWAALVFAVGLFLVDALAP